MPTDTLRKCIKVATERPHDGPYDVDDTGYWIASQGGMVVFVNLGLKLDFYRLALPCKLPAVWDLWHMDSAVRHVDPEIIKEGVTFDSSLLLSISAKELRAVIGTPDGERKFLGAVILVETADAGARFEVTFRFTEETRLVFDRQGWTLHEGSNVTRHEALQVVFSKLS